MNNSPLVGSRYFVGIPGELRGGRRYHLRYFVALAIDPKLLHPAAEGVRVKIEDPCSSLRPLDNSTALFECRQDMTSFRFLECGQPRTR